jgi:hypothetical protein
LIFFPAQWTDLDDTQQERSSLPERRQESRTAELSDPVALPADEHCAHSLEVLIAIPLIAADKPAARPRVLGMAELQAAASLSKKNLLLVCYVACL